MDEAPFRTWLEWDPDKREWVSYLPMQDSPPLTEAGAPPAPITQTVADAPPPAPEAPPPAPPDPPQSYPG